MASRRHSRGAGLKRHDSFLRPVEAAFRKDADDSAGVKHLLSLAQGGGIADAPVDGNCAQGSEKSACGATEQLILRHKMNLTPQARSQQNAVEVALVITRKDNRAALRDIFPASHLRMKEEAEQRPDEHIKEPVKKHHESPTFIFSFFN